MSPWDSIHNLVSEVSKVKSVLSGHSKIDKTKVLKTDGSLPVLIEFKYQIG